VGQVFYLDCIRTPLQVVSGSAAPGEAAQAEEAFSALRGLAKRVKARLFE
jgi:hypothetical protein